MTTVAQIVKDIEAVAPTAVPPVAIAKWIDNRYREMVSRVRFANLLRHGEVICPAPITTGTIDLTNGSSTVSGAGMTWDTDITSTEHVWLLVDNRWFKVSTIDSETGLTLAVAYDGSTVTGSAYKLVYRDVELAADCRWIVSAQNRHSALNLISLEEMTLTHGEFFVLSTYPVSMAHSGTAESGNVKVRFYPGASEDLKITYDYYAIPAALGLLTDIPPAIDGYVLKEGALIDLYRFCKMQKIEAGSIEAAGIYANEEARQRTIWNKHLAEAAVAQRAIDTVTTTLKLSNSRKVLSWRDMEILPYSS